MGFSAAWLELREAADHAARDAGLLTQAVEAAGAEPVIVDLGAGTGSTVRAFASHLPATTRWRLVDFDPELLAVAKAGQPDIEPHRLDLTDLSRLPLDGATLVSASALLDLVSRAWLESLAERLAALRLPFYAALSYDGVMRWEPGLPQDEAIIAAFNRDQQGVKSFGRALGPEAAGVAEIVFKRHGYTISTAHSPWLLDERDAALQGELLGGIANAAAEAGQDGADDWARGRIAAIADTRCQIGHIDLLALPPATG